VNKLKEFKLYQSWMICYYCFWNVDICIQL